MFIVPEADNSEAFEFSWKGKQYSFPRMANVTFDQISLVADLNDLKGMRALFEAVSPEFAVEAMGQMNTMQLGALVAAWQADSGITLGESSASTIS